MGEQGVVHAARASPLYRGLYAEIDLSGVVELAELPVVRKDALMERYADWVCDRRLELAGVRAHLETLRGDERYLGEYRCLATSGTSGQPGAFVYDRGEWRAMLAMMLRYSELAGVAPRVGRRVRVAMATSASPLHVTGRGAMSFELPGGAPIRRLDARAPVADIVAELNAFGPQYLSGYASLISELAVEQLEGRLRISPAAIATGGEVRGEEMTANIRAAWGVEPFDQYATTEGLFGSDCEHHAGIHVFEDSCLVEVIDEHGNPVPDGVLGDRLLFTSLIKRVQPLVRYEIDDRVALTREPCPCGRPLARIVSLQGRTSELMRLPGADGGTVIIHPHLLRAPLATIAGLRQYRVEQEPSGLQVEVRLRDGASAASVSQEIEAKLRAAVQEAGARTPQVQVRVVDHIARDAGHSGKLQQIRTISTRSREPAD